MADRVAVLIASDGGRRKRKSATLDSTGSVGSQQRADAKLAAVGKLQRTDTDTAVDDVLAAGAATQDSVQTAYAQTQQLAAAAHPQQQQHQHQHQQQRHQQHAAAAAAAQRHQRAAATEACEDADGSGSEVDGPIHDDKYIKGTRLVIGGWFQACRGCNEPTAHCSIICKRDVPLCPRCQSKYVAMVTGCYPPTSNVSDPGVEPLHCWLPRLLPPRPRLTPDQRREFCDMLVLRQDDAWLQLINMS